jgi:hypothetical protein
MATCEGSLQPAVRRRHEDSDPNFTSRCPKCGHAVEIHPIEPSETEGVWRLVHHDTDGYSLVMRSRGAVPWKERVIGPDDLP